MVTVAGREGPRGSPLPRVAGMATMPSRATAPAAIASVLTQVDRLWLFLDRFDTVPAYADDERIRVLRSQDVGDLRANGKLVGVALENEPCTFFALDDDVRYPTDYCATLEAHLERYRGTAVVGVHAAVLRPPMASYLRDTKVLHRRADQARSEGVDLLGSDSLAFRTTTLRFDVCEWKDLNIVDLCFARVARERSVPLVKIARPSHWVNALDENQDDSIWMGVLAEDRRQTVLARELMAIPRPRLPRGRLRRLRYRSV
jgi:hypothetical protein